MCSDWLQVYFDNGACVICKQPVQVDGPSPPATLGEKGSISINKASESRGHSWPGQQVHQDCRRKYCNPHQIAKTLKLGEQGHGSAIQTPALRSAERQFTWNTDCFFCGQPAKTGSKRKGYAANATVKTAKTIEVRDTILTACHERGDAWAQAMFMICILQMQCTTALISVPRNRYQHAQFMRAAPKEQNRVGQRGHKHSWRLLVFYKRMMMNRSPSKI